MFERLVELALRNRLLFLLLGVGLIGAGAYTLTKTPVDAFPDTTPVQVQINTVAPALNPEEIEQQLTLPVELAIGGLPGLSSVRSISKFGLSQVVATFDDDTRIIDARQYVSEEARHGRASFRPRAASVGPHIDWFRRGLPLHPSLRG